MQKLHLDELKQSQIWHLDWWDWIMFDWLKFDILSWWAYEIDLKYCIVCLDSHLGGGPDSESGPEVAEPEAAKNRCKTGNSGYKETVAKKGRSRKWFRIRSRKLQEKLQKKCFQIGTYHVNNTVSQKFKLIIVFNVNLEKVFVQISGSEGVRTPDSLKFQTYDYWNWKLKYLFHFRKA